MKNGDGGGRLNLEQWRHLVVINENTISWCLVFAIQARLSHFTILFFPVYLQLRWVCHAAGGDAATAGCGRGWEEDPQLPAANGHPAEVGSHAASGRPRVWPWADPPRRQLRALQGSQQGPRWHLQRLACKSESHLLWLWPTRAQQCRAQRHCGRSHSLLQWEVQDLLRLRSLCKGLLCTDGRGFFGPDPPYISVKEPHFARLAPWPACAPLGTCRVTNQLLLCASVNAWGNANTAYVLCALDVWTVVDIFGMWVVGPRLYWGFCEFSEASILSAVTVLYVWCERWRFCAVRLALWVFCLVTVTHHCGGFVKRTSIDARRRPLLFGIGAPLRKASISPGAPRIDLCPAARCAIR